MKKKHLPLRTSVCGVPTADLADHIADFLFSRRVRNASKATLDKYTTMTKNLLWFLEDRKMPFCGRREVQEFMIYVRDGDPDTGARWGRDCSGAPARPSTVATYFTVIQTLFKFLTEEDIVDSCPLRSNDRPIARTDQIQPFTDDEVLRLLKAAGESRHPLRDRAIIYLLLDTGIRASELCGLKFRDVDIESHSCRVLGKGNKERSVAFSDGTARKLWPYLREIRYCSDPDSPLFPSDRGKTGGEAITRNGLFQLIRRLGKAAEVADKRCSPHTFRHTFAITYLRNGANVYGLKSMMGHTSLTICQRYLAITQADIQQEHQKCSPVESMLRNQDNRSPNRKLIHRRSNA